MKSANFADRKLLGQLTRLTNQHDLRVSAMQLELDRTIMFALERG